MPKPDGHHGLQWELNAILIKHKTVSSVVLHSLHKAYVRIEKRYWTGDVCGWFGASESTDIITRFLNSCSPKRSFARVLFSKQSRRRREISIEPASESVALCLKRTVMYVYMFLLNSEPFKWCDSVTATPAIHLQCMHLLVHGILEKANLSNKKLRSSRSLLRSLQKLTSSRYSTSAELIAYSDTPSR